MRRSDATVRRRPPAAGRRARSGPPASASCALQDLVLPACRDAVGAAVQAVVADQLQHSLSNRLGLQMATRHEPLARFVELVALRRRKLGAGVTREVRLHESRADTVDADV